MLKQKMSHDGDADDHTVDGVNGRSSDRAMAGAEARARAEEHLEQEEEEDDENDYIVVTEREDGLGAKLELPAEADGSLTIATLAHSFPNAIGLKFENPKNGIYRALAVDTAGTRILAPKGGWRNKTYVVIFKPKDPLVVASSVVSPEVSSQSKRRRLDEESEHGRAARVSSPDETDSSVRKTCDLVVLNLPFKTTDEALKTYFEKFGEVVVAEIKTDFRSGQPKGFGFVQMRDYESQTKVLDQYEHFIDGRMTQVKIPNSRMRPSHDQGSSGHHHYRSPLPPSHQYMADTRHSEPICTKMYVGRVPASFTQDEIRSFFDKEAKKLAPHAQVDHVLIPKPHRGFAFVTFNDPEVTRKIIRVSDFVVNGISLCVSAASPKDQTQPSPLSSAQGGQLPGSNYGYGYGYGTPPQATRGLPPRDSPSYASRDDSWGGGSPWGGPHSEHTGYGGGAGNYPGYGGGGYGNFGQSRPPVPTGPVPPSAAGGASSAGMSDTNLQAAWSAFWATLQGQPGGQANAAPPSTQPPI